MSKRGRDLDNEQFKIDGSLPEARPTTPRLEHVPYFEGNPLNEKARYQFLGDGTLLISCANCKAVATLFPATEMYLSITSGNGMRCSKCFYQCRTHLRELEKDKEK